MIVDLTRMPHLLVAGTTGSGKSVAINTMILSLLYRMKPERCRLIMVDPKMLELSAYDGIPHLLTPVVTDPKKAVIALKWAVREMEERYKKMSKVGVRNIDGFNARVAEAVAKGEALTRTVQTGFDRETGEAIYESEDIPLDELPYIVVVVDEMADLMMVAGKDIEGAIQRLAQMARAAGIHLIMATQRPSVDVITGTIKANFPTRISFQVTSKIDSRTILGEQGAEQLLGQGDMLYMAGGGRISRVHGPFVSDNEVEKVVAHIKKQGAPEYLHAITEDNEASEGRRRGPPALPRLDGRRGIGRLLRPRGQHRAARPQGVDELHPAPPLGRLQQGGFAGRADGEGGRGQRPQSLGQAGDPDRQWRRPGRVRGSERGLAGRLRLARASSRRRCHFRVPFLAIPIGCGAISESLRDSGELDRKATLALAMHRPDLAAHIDQMKSAPRQFAHGDDIAAMHRRPGVGRRVFDLMTVSHVEMLHRCLRVRCRRARPPLTEGRADSSFCCIAQFHAAMHNTQARGRAFPAAAAPSDALTLLHPFLHVMAQQFSKREQKRVKASK